MTSKPATYERLMVYKLSTNFREAVQVERARMCYPEKDQICVKNKYVGVNATDINITKGRYLMTKGPPFSVGFEGIGEVIDIGASVTDVLVGQIVAYRSSLINAYAEYVCLPVNDVFLIPEIKAEYLSLTVCGLTASIGLDKCARITGGETVLITAAAGGTGHIAVQWAKAANCHVIGTCSSNKKATILKDLGCDCVINYKKENLEEILAKEYKNGIDVVWETIGGQIFEVCLKNLARKGRLVIVGSISGYKSEDSGIVPKMDLSQLPQQLLSKSAAVLGYRVLEYKECFATYFKYMMDSINSGQLNPIIDDGIESTGFEFVGIRGIIRAVEHLHSGKSIGKIVVRIS